MLERAYLKLVTPGITSVHFNLSEVRILLFLSLRFGNALYLPYTKHPKQSPYNPSDHVRVVLEYDWDKGR